MPKFVLVFNGAIILGCAVLFPSANYLYITTLFLLLPFLDIEWRERVLGQTKLNNIRSNINYILICIYIIFLLLHPEYLLAAVGGLLLVALPEEWFFRFYLLSQLDEKNKTLWLNNIICSLLFAASHLPSQGIAGAAVFLPSLLFGYMYQRTNNLLVAVLLHGLSNFIYLIYKGEIV